MNWKRVWVEPVIPKSAQAAFEHASASRRLAEEYADRARTDTANAIVFAQSLGLSVRQIAKQMGISYQRVAQIAREQTQPETVTATTNQKVEP